MDRLIACGWDDETAPLLAALRSEARLEPVAVGDPHAGNLVRARSATRLPCYQHLHEMARAIDYEAVLIADSGYAEDLATTAALRGADLLVAASSLDAEALTGTVTAATRHGVALALFRPSLRTAGFAFLTDLIDADPRWLPLALDIELCGEQPVAALLRDASAAALRLSKSPSQVVASMAGLDPEAPVSAAAHLRATDGTLVTLRVQHGAPRLRISGQAGAGTFEVASRDGESRVTCIPWTGESEHSVLRDADPLVLEAQRVERIRSGEPLDAHSAHREAALLQAVERALVSGEVTPVAAGEPRSALRVIAGGGHLDASHRARLHVI